MGKGVLREVGKQLGGFLKTAKKGLESYGSRPRRSPRSRPTRRRRR